MPKRPIDLTVSDAIAGVAVFESPARIRPKVAGDRHLPQIAPRRVDLADIRQPVPTRNPLDADGDARSLKARVRKREQLQLIVERGIGSKRKI